MKKIIARLLAVPGFSSFVKDGDLYRVTGFYYRYQFQDGTYSDPYRCSRLSSNCIGGSGICGIVLPFEEVDGWGLKIDRARFHFFIRFLKSGKNPLIKQQKEKTKILKKMPSNMDREAFEEWLIKDAIKKAMKTLTKKNPQKT
jgi:hypothetical protein